jgi:hypothetical protein
MTPVEEAWQELALAECDHHPHCAARAVADLVRLGELPEQRRAVAAD